MTMRMGASALTVALLAGCAPQINDGPKSDPATVRTELKAHLDETAALLAKGSPAAAIVDQAYWPDAVTVMEGVPAALRGTEPLTGVMAASSKEGVGMTCDFTLDEPVILSGDVASAFSAATCGEGDKTMKMRTLYVWQQRDGHWKIIREMISQGALN
jgi:ketosteroid isomerase-like protein